MPSAWMAPNLPTTSIKGIPISSSSASKAEAGAAVLRPAEMLLLKTVSRGAKADLAVRPLILPLSHLLKEFYRTTNITPTEAGP